MFYVSNFNKMRSLTMTFKVLKPHSLAIASARNSSTVTDPDAPNFNMENPFEKERQQCILCKYKIPVDYKNVKLLSQFQSPYTGRIYGKHITGLCKQQQEIVEKEIIKAQAAGLMASYLKEEAFLKDPKLYNVEKPIRPHRF